MSRETLVSELIRAQARALKMPGLARVFEGLARQAREEKWAFEDYLQEVLAAEQTSRAESAIKQRIHDARFPEMKTLDGFDFREVEADGLNPSHPATRRYTYGASALAVTDISGTTRTTKALHLDALGSPSVETTQTGAVAAVRQYDAWGQYRNGTAPVSTDAKLGYTGHQFDPETRLVYANARYYDPEYGRFLSRDEMEGALNSAPSLHRFAYGNFNPLRYRDPSGHMGVRQELEAEAKSWAGWSTRIGTQALAQGDQWKKGGLVLLAGAAQGLSIVSEGLGYVWKGFDRATGGSIKAIDKINDATAKYNGEHGTLRYIEDINRETTDFALRSVARIGVGKLLPAGTPAVLQKIFGGVAKVGIEEAAAELRASGDSDGMTQRAPLSLPSVQLTAPPLLQPASATGGWGFGVKMTAAVAAGSSTTPGVGARLLGAVGSAVLDQGIEDAFGDLSGMSETELPAEGPPDSSAFDYSRDGPPCPATFGTSCSTDYRTTFLERHPELESEVVVHHAVEQVVLDKFPGTVTEEEMHSFENLRGIPNEMNSDIHLSKIRLEWNRFYEQNPSPTKQDLLDKATEIDALFGPLFKPPR